MASAASIVAPRLNQSALARLLGVSRQAVNDLVKRGVLTSDADGLIDVELARYAITQRVRPSSKTSAALDAATVKPPPAANVNDSSAADDVAVTSYHAAKTLREAEEARIARLKREEMEGALIRTTAVRTVIANTLASTRESLLQIPARMATVLASETDAARVHDLLQAELHSALAQLVSLPERAGPESRAEAEAEAAK